jgi:methylase of polypeptide subunit release factors
VFFCPEESHFYSHCLERLVFNHCCDTDTIVEFGCGDGTPVLNSLIRTNFVGPVHGYELNPAASQVAQSKVSQYGLDHQYFIHTGSFFESPRLNAEYLIANPPYLPAPDTDILMPLLYGGFDGGAITNALLRLEYPNVMVLVSSYSNPVHTIAEANANGYSIEDFMVTPLQFGYYSSEPKVRNHIAQLQKNHQAFYSGNTYFLAGVLFRKSQLSNVDLSNELIQVMTSL